MSADRRHRVTNAEQPMLVTRSIMIPTLSAFSVGLIQLRVPLASGKLRAISPHVYISVVCSNAIGRIQLQNLLRASELLGPWIGPDLQCPLYTCDLNRSMQHLDNSSIGCTATDLLFRIPTPI